MPDDVGYVFLDLWPKMTDISGIDQQSQRAGAAAIDLAVAEIRQGERGIPLHPKILMIDESSATLDDGCWAPENYFLDGRNLLSNRHDRKSEKATDRNAGRGNVMFVDGHAEFFGRADALKPEYFDPTIP